MGLTENGWLLVASVLLPISIALAIGLRSLRRMPPDARSTIVRLGTTYVVVAAVARLTYSFAGSRLSYAAVNASNVFVELVTEVLAFAIALAAIRAIWPGLLAGSPSLEPLGAEVVRTYVRQIISSDSFVNALNETLPSGKHDDEYGLNTVPHLLAAIRHRRDRVAASARKFLWLTMVAAGLTALIVTFFAWVLVSDDSVGAPRALHDLRETSAEIATQLRLLNRDYHSTRDYQSLVKAAATPASDATASLRQQLQVALAGQITLDELLTRLMPIRQRLTFVTGDEAKFATLVVSSISGLQDLANDQRSAFDSLGQLRSRLATLLDRVGDDIGKDRNRIAEVIRRLALGLIVATFFLAIVRFVANLYRSDYQQVLRADFDEMLVRSFYVTYKASEGLVTQRSAILAAYVAALSKPERDVERASTKDDEKKNLDLLREIIMAAAKRV